MTRLGGFYSEGGWFISILIGKSLVNFLKAFLTMFAGSPRLFRGCLRCSPVPLGLTYSEFGQSPIRRGSFSRRPRLFRRESGVGGSVKYSVPVAYSLEREVSARIFLIMIRTDKYVGLHLDPIDIFFSILSIDFNSR